METSRTHSAEDFGEISRGCPGDIMVILGIYWGYLGEILGRYWIDFDEILGRYRRNVGEILGTSWREFGEILRRFWDDLGSFFCYFATFRRRFLNDSDGSPQTPTRRL